MNVKRFIARSSREALNQVRMAFGADAVVLSNRPCEHGVEVLAMAPGAIAQIEKVADATPHEPAQPAAPVATSAAAKRAAQPAAAQAQGNTPVEQDVQSLAMSTLSFQDYVRERLLRRRRAAMQQPDAPETIMPTDEERSPAQASAATPRTTPAATQLAQPPMQPARHPMPAQQAMPHVPQQPQPQAHAAHAHPEQPPQRTAAAASVPITMPAARETLRLPDAVPSLADPAPAQREQIAVMNELRAVKGLIEDRFSALAFMEQLHRNPRQSTLSQRLLESGFSPALTRKLVEHLPANATDEVAWAHGVLARNLPSDEAGVPIEDMGGVYALIGATGVGKTTSTAKIAASFAARHGASNLGLITLDAYRMAAHEQLRAYGRILGVPVHTAHDRASLDDLLDLLGGKKLVLIDTAGMAQRDQRTRELLDMLAHRAIQRLLVVNAASQGETVEDVMQAYGAAQCRGAVLSKIDEAVKLAPALDALIRHKLRVVGVANGQRVPEDWHRLSSSALIQRALRPHAMPAWHIEPADVNLMFAAQRPAATAAWHA
ncbi:MAG TPA: flagellar biosynthesis protein FlhF [Burkholderiaceae bacterium]|nr:flagellar biosynthesis protein FlhF [Burkholderiaceae bacterium]